MAKIKKVKESASVYGPELRFRALNSTGWRLVPIEPVGEGPAANAASKALDQLARKALEDAKRGNLRDFPADRARS